MCTPQTILAVLELSLSCTRKNLYYCGRVGWAFSLEKYILLTGSVLKKEHTEERAYSQKSCLRVFSALQNKIRWWFLWSGTKWSVGVHCGIILLGTTAGEWWCVPLGSSQIPGKDHCTGPDSLEASVSWVRVEGRLDGASLQVSASPWFPLLPTSALSLRSACVLSFQTVRVQALCHRSPVVQSNQRACQGICP